LRQRLGLDCLGLSSALYPRCPHAATTLGGSAPLAQLDRASVYGTEGREFESLRARARMLRSRDFLPASTAPFDTGHRSQAYPRGVAGMRLGATGSSPPHPHTAALGWRSTATSERVGRTEEAFNGGPRGAVGERPEAKRPVVAKLLADGCTETRGLKTLPAACMGTADATFEYVLLTNSHMSCMLRRVPSFGLGVGANIRLGLGRLRVDFNRF
jgi:hypothetical protein